MEHAVVPLPSSLRPSTGAPFPLTASTPITGDPSTAAELQRIIDVAASTRPEDAMPDPPAIDLRIEPGGAPESYTLSSMETGVTVTGADAASIVMGSLSSNGAEHPRRGVVIFWGTLTGAVAAVMLLAGGDEPSEALSGLQRVTIVAALPFILVMLLLCFALAKDLRRDPLSLRRRLATSVVERAIRTGVEQHRGVQFDLVTKHECAETCPDSDCPGGTPTGSIPTVDSTPRSPEDK